MRDYFLNLTTGKCTSEDTYPFVVFDSFHLILLQWRVYYIPDIVAHTFLDLPHTAHTIHSQRHS